MITILSCRYNHFSTTLEALLRRLSFNKLMFSASYMMLLVFTLKLTSLQPVGAGQALLLQESRVEQLRLIACSRVGEDRHHGVTGTESARETDGTGDIDAARAAEHQPF